MTSLHLQPPGPFDWLKWKRRFEQYCHTSGLSSEGSEERQVSTLLYCLSEEANDVLTSTGLSDTDRNKYETVMSKFDEFFKVRRNIIIRFNQRNQLKGESAETYITALYGLIENCNFGALKDELLRDRLVVGIQDQKLSQQLQMDADLTLEKAKKLIRQKEAVKEQSQELDGETQKEAALEGLRQKCAKPPPTNRKGGASGLPKTNSLCTRCGRGRHQRGERCPAAHAVCHSCGRRGHYGAQFFSTNCTQKASLDSAFLDTLTNSQESA